MKISSLFSLLTIGASGFSSPATVSVPRQQQQLSPTALHARSDEGAILSKAAMAAAVLGCSLMMGPMIAGADSTSLDFSLPSYDSKMSGFGDGTEAYLTKQGRADRTDPGANEKEKQAVSMQKAEEARLEAKEKKKAEMKALEDEAKRRAAERKARDAERLKNIWN